MASACDGKPRSQFWNGAALRFAHRSSCRDKWASPTVQSKPRRGLTSQEILVKYPLNAWSRGIVRYPLFGLPIRLRP